MDFFNSGSPSKTPALFRMPEWSKPKILTEDEKRDVFAADFEEGRNKAEARAKRERLEKAAKDARHKEGRSDFQIPRGAFHRQPIYYHYPPANWLPHRQGGNTLD
ncbi:hypothetical protein DFH08DRAFT_968460 [Mycena albidolilacea]|uniref:Uncharacterized protein n=1 Tax=Mycena albidolilacea TaxID=1033008 RepID=A0AAD6ZJL0_9AGAR|nr:hypothetical protein DFH08DRAFT_968460 [Mycena albidolilacea]